MRCTSVLEIGCGTGIDLRLFPDTFQIHGIDLNDRALNIAKVTRSTEILDPIPVIVRGTMSVHFVLEACIVLKGLSAAREKGLLPTCVSRPCCVIEEKKQSLLEQVNIFVRTQVSQSSNCNH